jgi:hypothetical protein
MFPAARGRWRRQDNPADRDRSRKQFQAPAHFLSIPGSASWTNGVVITGGRHRTSLPGKSAKRVFYQAPGNPSPS